MTVELLDTDTEQGGEMAEVERWSEYVDKYLCIGGNISDELKQQLTRKPVFLSRYVLNTLRPPAGRQMAILPMPISQQPFNRS